MQRRRKWLNRVLSIPILCVAIPLAITFEFISWVGDTCFGNVMEWAFQQWDKDKVIDEEVEWDD